MVLFRSLPTLSEAHFCLYFVVCLFVFIWLDFGFVVFSRRSMSFLTGLSAALGICYVLLINPKSFWAYEMAKRRQRKKSDFSLGVRNDA